MSKEPIRRRAACSSPAARPDFEVVQEAIHDLLRSSELGDFNREAMAGPE